MSEEKQSGGQKEYNTKVWGAQKAKKVGFWSERGRGVLCLWLLLSEPPYGQLVDWAFARLFLLLLFF